MVKYDEDANVEYKEAKGLLTELAELLEIDYKTLVKNLDTLDIRKAIKNCQEDKFRKTANYEKMLVDYIEEHGKQYGLDGKLPKGINALQYRVRKINSLKKVEDDHKTNILRIKTLLEKLDTTDPVIQYLLVIKYGYESVPAFSKDLYKSLILIYSQGLKGQYTEYKQIEKRMGRENKELLNKYVKYIEHMIKGLDDEKRKEVISCNGELYTRYKVSIEAAKMLTKVLNKYWKMHLDKMRTKQDIEMQTVVEQKDRKLEVTIMEDTNKKLKRERKKVNPEFKRVIELLNVKLIIQKELINKAEFSKLKVEDICNQINNSELTIKDVLEYTLKNKKDRSMDWFVENYSGRKTSIGSIIGKIMVEANIVKRYKTYEISGINGLVKIGLEMMERARSGRLREE